MTSSPVLVAVRLLRATLWTALLTCVALAVLGVVWVLADEASHDDPWDGLGTWFGTVLAGSAAVCVVVAGLLLLALTRSLRHRDRTGSAAALSLTGLAAAVVAAPFVVVALGDLRTPLAALGLVPGAVVVGSTLLALALAGEARQPRNDATSSW